VPLQVDAAGIAPDRKLWSRNGCPIDCKSHRRLARRAQRTFLLSWPYQSLFPVLALFNVVIGRASGTRRLFQLFAGRRRRRPWSTLGAARAHPTRIAQSARPVEEFIRIWQDKEAIASGKLWKAEITTAIGQSAFFIPIITPTVVGSKYCRFELESFLARETALGRNDLIFPILYIKVPALDDAVRSDGDQVLSIITKSQYSRLLPVPSSGRCDPGRQKIS
jgi:hypothetical protein